MTTVLINATNLHVGGGVQVATSFIEEISAMDMSGIEVVVYASTEVFQNLTRLNVDLRAFAGFEVIDMHGVLGGAVGKLSKFRGFDLVFTVFGPAYALSFKKRHIVGFAKAQLLVDEGELVDCGIPAKSLRYRLKRFVQKWAFTRAETLLVELEFVKDEIVKRWGWPEQSVHVARNCVSRIYRNPDRWIPAPVIRDSGSLNIGYLGRDYPHKNISILPEVKRLLAKSYGVDATFHVTLTDDEWARRSDEFRQEIKNVGPLEVAQCPSFCREMDAIIFPSLLECFSATPLEAMATETPLFASDRSYVRNICGDYAFYFDPKDPQSIASVIASKLGGEKSISRKHLSEARRHALKFSDARARAEAYWDAIMRALERDEAK